MACYRMLETTGVIGDDAGLERWRWMVEYEGADTHVEVLAIGNGLL